MKYFVASKFIQLLFWAFFIVKNYKAVSLRVSFFCFYTIFRKTSSFIAAVRFSRQKKSIRITVAFFSEKKKRCVNIFQFFAMTTTFDVIGTSCTLSSIKSSSH